MSRVKGGEKSPRQLALEVHAACINRHRKQPPDLCAHPRGTDILASGLDRPARSSITVPAAPGFIVFGRARPSKKVVSLLPRGKKC